MECKGGHKLNDSVMCGGSCDGTLYWVDGDEKYAICRQCGDISKLSGKLNCRACGKPSKCTVKWNNGYKP